MGNFWDFGKKKVKGFSVRSTMDGTDRSMVTAGGSDNR